MADLAGKVLQLSEARAAAAKHRAELAALEHAWRMQEHVAAAARAAEDAARQVAALEAEVREVACAFYVATGAKAPVPGVSIAITKRVAYDEERVLRWALAKGLCLTLDARAFEALAKRNVPRDDAGAPLAVLEEVPQARISSSIGAPPVLGAVGQWQVPSDSQSGVTYTVTRDEEGGLTCTCPAGAAGRPCKHLARIPGGAPA